MLAKRPIAIKVDKIEEPPAEIKGKGTPVIGIRLIMPPIFKNVCTANQAIMPVAKALP